jgi:hypothetical protein
LDLSSDRILNDRSTTWFDLNNGHDQVLPLKNTLRKILLHKHQFENQITCTGNFFLQITLKLKCWTSNDSCSKVAKIVESIFLNVLLKINFRGIITICCDMYARLTNPLCGQNVEFLGSW